MGRISSVIEGIGFNAHVHLAKLIAYRTQHSDLDRRSFQTYGRGSSSRLQGLRAADACRDARRLTGAMPDSGTPCSYGGKSVLSESSVPHGFSRSHAPKTLSPLRPEPPPLSRSTASIMGQEPISPVILRYSAPRLIIRSIADGTDLA
jgi:hypothetical protein